MISPLLRRVANYHKRSIISRSVSSASINLNRLYLTQRTIPSISSISSIFFQSQNRRSAPYQTVRMASNSANKKFTRDHLFDCKGRVALVTGGGSGIGLMITQALVANGAKVYITGRTREKLDRVVKKYSGGDDSIIAITADVTSKEEIRKLVKEIESREPNGLGILVNNAGISGSTFQTEASSAQEMKKNLFDAEASTFEDWTSVYKTNVAQIFFMTTAFLPLLQKSTESSPGWSGTVLNITSISGLVKSPQHHFQYNASKAAANHLTRMLSAEITAGNGIKVRINAIAPGVFPSEMTAGGSGDDQKSYIPKEKYEGKVPAERPGRDEDMAQAALCCVCNQYMNGSTLVVDGGYTVAVGQ
ncbi:hypothetical protein HD806DRAFT_505340 [Xylariaceae sp. AK1471]|nr:hypothetical protein HD806DRAFT_505340 [Xylariaceae sp. AK1471]